ncbi:MAG: type II toxin-antitoxin system RelE/ParE family toxin [Fibrobacterales bacterium]
MPYQVLLLADAEQDLKEIYQYLFMYESANLANDLLDKIEQAVKNLFTFPNRGHVHAVLDRRRDLQDLLETRLLR